jgi:hypothetical protein
MGGGTSQGNGTPKMMDQRTRGARYKDYVKKERPQRRNSNISVSAQIKQNSIFVTVDDGIIGERRRKKDHARMGAAGQGRGDEKCG